MLNPSKERFSGGVLTIFRYNMAIFGQQVISLLGHKKMKKLIVKVAI